jgi:hypothetical protein
MNARPITPAAHCFEASRSGVNLRIHYEANEAGAAHVDAITLTTDPSDLKPLLDSAVVGDLAALAREDLAARHAQLRRRVVPIDQPTHAALAAGSAA